MNCRLWLTVICLTAISSCTDGTVSEVEQRSSLPSPMSSTAAATQNAMPASTSSPTTAASRIYIDPDTGQPRAPTPEELAAETAQRKQINATSSTARPSVTVTPLPNGMTEYDLGDAARVDETACLQPDGSLGECSAQQKQELRARTQQHK